jgi:peptidoglycan/xylan/chitin deacetylase (PgdA/CDA1 family)
VPAVTVLHALTFHGLGVPPRALDPGEQRVWVAAGHFEAILDRLAGRQDVLVTFDDGNRSDAEIALPALARRGLRGAFFPTAHGLGQPGFLGPEELRELVKAGMTVGSHGFAHRPWRDLAPEELHEELVVARERLEEAAGVRIDQAACPFGAYDRRSLAAIREAGYTRVYTSDRGPADPAAWLQPRTTVCAGDGPEDIERLWLEPEATHWALLRRAKLALKRWR